jgi:hypothetical protein
MASTGAGRTAYRGWAPAKPRHLGDCTLTSRVLPITGIALVVGAAGAGTTVTSEEP